MDGQSIDILLSLSLFVVLLVVVLIYSLIH